MNYKDKWEICLRENQAQAAWFSTLASDHADEWWTLSAMYGAMADAVEVLASLPDIMR